MQEADGYKQRVIAQAEGDSSRFGQVVAEYAKAPVVTRQRMYIDTMQEIYSNAVKVIVDAHSGSNLMLLPLDKLLQQATQESARAAAQASGAATGSSTTSAAAPAAASGSSEADRSRDGLRSRDRDVR